MTTIIYPGTVDYDALLANLKSEPSSILCGSAISMYAPTSLQSGASVTWALAEALAGAANVGQEYADLIYKSAFEVILQTYPKQDVLSVIFENYFRYYEHSVNLSMLVVHNDLHISIAKMISTGIVSNVVTTNYDCCLEHAFAHHSLKKPTPIVKQRDRLKAANGNIFKIHGCAARKGTPVFSMRQENSMPAWKRRKLVSLIGDRMIVVGYSGLDFEICPELYQIQLKQIVWIARPDDKDHKVPDLKPNARKVIAKFANSFVICGDMRELLTELSGHDCSKAEPPDKSPPKPRISDIILNELTDHERRLWAARLFNELGIPSAIENIIQIESALGALSHELRRLRVGAMNHMGMFLDAADVHSSLADDVALPLSTRISHKIGESGSCSMGGFELRAVSALDDADLLATRLSDVSERKSMRNSIEWMKLVLERGNVDRTDAAKVDAIVARLRILYKSAVDTGEYGLAGLCINEIKELKGEGGSALPAGHFERNAKDMFEQIGNFVGQVTAERDKARRSMSPADAAVLEERITSLDEFRLYPELWRVLYTLIHFKVDVSERQQMFNMFELYLLKCQLDKSYSDAMLAEGRSALLSPKGIASVP
jgi:SIR2-like domain